MLTKFVTVTGSVYEVDEANNKCRRVSGEHPPTERQGEDGQWSTYLTVSEIEPPRSVRFTWRIDDGVAKCTDTTAVVAVWMDGLES